MDLLVKKKNAKKKTEYGQRLALKKRKLKLKH